MTQGVRHVTFPGGNGWVRDPSYTITLFIHRYQTSHLLKPVLFSKTYPRHQPPEIHQDPPLRRRAAIFARSCSVAVKSLRQYPAHALCILCGKQLHHISASCTVHTRCIIASLSAIVHHDAQLRSAAQSPPLNQRLDALQSLGRHVVECI